MAKAAAAKSMNKSNLVTEIANATSLTRKQISGVFDALTDVLKREMGKKGPGVLNVMRLVKVYRVTKPAQKEGMRPNPFKPGEMMVVKAKPARNVIKVRPLKDLKSMA
jgi:nucleoid DNA-binding protein